MIVKKTANTVRKPSGTEAMPVLSLQQITEDVALAAREYPIKKVELFGSYANGTSHTGSDVDLLVEFFAPHVSLLTLNSVKYRLEGLLGVNVDIVHAPLCDGSILEIDRKITIYE